METIQFDPKWRVVDNIGCDFSDKQIEEEPMLYGADVEFAYANGGPITKMFCNKVLLDGFNRDPIGNFIVDSRVHMLMPGWYPCIPGWHIDFVPRTREDKQPNFKDPNNNARHVCMVYGKSAMTEFLWDAAIIDIPPVGEPVFESINKQINEKEHVPRVTIKSGDIIEFGQTDFHRGQPATEFCWRFFIRASEVTGRKAVNKIRKQSQVYLKAVEGGW